MPAAHVATAVSNVKVARGVRIAETRGPHDGAQHALGCLCGWIGWAVRRRWLHGGLDVCVGGVIFHLLKTFVFGSGEIDPRLLKYLEKREDENKKMREREREREREERERERERDRQRERERERQRDRDRERGGAKSFDEGSRGTRAWVQ